MPLIERADLEQQFSAGEISQLVGTDTHSEQRLADAIERTQTEIESRLADRYELPLQPTRELKEIAGHLVRARLYTHNPPEWITDAAEQNRRYLDEANRGRRGIQGLTVRGARKSSAVRTTRTRADRTFTDETLAGY